MKKKLTYLIFIATAVLFICLAAQPDQSMADAHTCASGGSNNIAHTSCSYNVSTAGHSYAVSLDIYHCKTHYSDAVACQVGIAESTNKLSQGITSGNWAQGCGNSWGTFSGSQQDSAAPTSSAPPDPCPGGTINPAYTSYVQAHVTPIMQEYYSNMSNFNNNPQGQAGDRSKLGGNGNLQQNQFQSMRDLQKKIQDALVGAPASCIYPDANGCYAGTAVNPAFAEYAKQMNELQLKAYSSGTGNSGRNSDGSKTLFDPQTINTRTQMNDLRMKMFSINRCLSIDVNTDTNATTLTRECTPGVDCPELDLGKIIEEARLGRAYADSKNTCPFFYITGTEDAERKISCAIISNGRTSIVPKIENDNVNGYGLPIGVSTFTCSRSDGKTTTTESKTFTCNGNPNTIER